MAVAIDSKLSNIFEVLKAEYSSIRLFLFGSRASGKIHIDSERNNQSSIDDLKKMDLSPKTIQKIEHTLEQLAKSKIAEVQGQYYETYD